MADSQESAPSLLHDYTQRPLHVEVPIVIEFLWLAVLLEWSGPRLGPLYLVGLLRSNFTNHYGEEA